MVTHWASLLGLPVLSCGINSWAMSVVSKFTNFFHLNYRVKYLIGTWVSICITDGISILRKDRISISVKFSDKN